MLLRAGLRTQRHDYYGEVKNLFVSNCRLRVDVSGRQYLTGYMRFLACLLLGAMMLSGCAENKSTVWPLDGGPVSQPAAVSRAKTNPAPTPKLIVSPEIILVGKVVRYNSEGRFVVLNFPVGHLPGVDQRLYVYRQGLKVGEVKANGPQLDDNTVADIVAGEAQVGDEVRDK